MRMMNRLSMFSGAGLLTLAACAQNSDSTIPPPASTTPAPASAPNVVADLAKDVAGIEQKFVDLAKAMPEGSYAWRPMPGVRSVREVYLHIAGENYLLPSMMGTPVPTETGITDFKSVDGYEKREIKRDSVVATIQASFAHIKKVMAADSAAAMTANVDFFGTKMSRQAAWVGVVTHMHEHLGQSIAYARMNKVVPPWSK